MNRVALQIFAVVIGLILFITPVFTYTSNNGTLRHIDELDELSDGVVDSIRRDMGEFPCVVAVERSNNVFASIKEFLIPKVSACSTGLSQVPGSEKFFVGKNGDTFNIDKISSIQQKSFYDNFQNLEGMDKFIGNRKPNIEISDRLSLANDYIKTQEPNQLHHIMTNKGSRLDEMKDIADSYGLNLDDSWNKIEIPHNGRHPEEYHDWIISESKKIDSVARGNTQEFLRLFNDIKKDVQNNPSLLRKEPWRWGQDITQFLTL